MNKKPEYAHWNGKNPNGQSQVGNPDLIEAGPRNTKTAAKYDISTETIAAEELQKQSKKQ